VEGASRFLAGVAGFGMTGFGYRFGITRFEDDDYGYGAANC